jgi:hypothetical protein
MLLDNLAKTPADRTNLLASYFEPTSEELAKGLKAPTLAHRSIARIVANGYVRVIITTNFDRLLERALEETGVSPAVISTPDAVRGALPLAHARCSVLKIHGDYRDTRIKNTGAELETYEDEMNLLLDRILDEYGLVICGWSAAWDKALCRAVLRCPNRRFTTFWARRARLTEEARAIINYRQAIELEIESADSFFKTLETKIDAIERYSQPHPASTKLAVVSLKKFIAEEKTRIELRDLVATETERTSKTLSSLSVHDPGLTVEKCLERMKFYENASEILISILAHGAFWGRTQHQKLWMDCISRIAATSGVRYGGAAQTHLITLQIYPACLLFYSICLGSMAGNNYETIKRVCRDTYRRQNGEQQPLIRVILPWSVLDLDIARKLPGYEGNWTPVNNRIFEILREPLREYLPDENDYEDIFDRCEYLTALVHLDIQMSGESFANAPVGRFGWRRSVHSKPVEQRVSEDAEKYGERWGAITSGLFASVSRFKQVEQAYKDSILNRTRVQWY